MKNALLAAGTVLLVALPASAFANCPAVPVGSAMVSCEQGVQVVRQTSSPIRVIAPAQSAQLHLQRKRLAQMQARQTQQTRLDAQRLELERERVRQQGYLIRDRNSPLRQRTRPQGFGMRGHANNGVIIVQR